MRQYLTRCAAAESVPPDWCYVNNFDEPHKPRALQLPSGTGVASSLTDAGPSASRSTNLRRHGSASA